MTCAVTRSSLALVHDIAVQGRAIATYLPQMLRHGIAAQSLGASQQLPVLGEARHKILLTLARPPFSQFHHDRKIRIAQVELC